MAHEVWITGIGVVSALGAGYEEHAEALRMGRSGLVPHELFGGREPDPCVCGIVPHRCMPHSIEESAGIRADLLLDFALRQALVSAGLGAGIHADIIAGTTLGNMHGATRYYSNVREGRPADPSLVRHFLPCMPLAWAARHNGIAGRRLTVCSACASSNAALGLAFRRISRGQCSRAIAGGFDAMSPFVAAGFNSLRLISAVPCKPFARDRNGLNPGEAAAMLVLESKEAAAERGARPLARLAGYGEALEAYHYTRSDPRGSGTEAALRKALTSAGAGPDAIGAIHLHGTGTEANDRSEYVACRSVFGDRLAFIPACSTKSATGHTFGAAGALNAVLSIISICERIIPATLFSENIDPEFAGLSISTRVRETSVVEMIASSALGFGGEASVVIIARAPEDA